MVLLYFENLSRHILLTEENDCIEPSLLDGGQLKVALCGREKKRDAEDLYGIAGHRPAAQQQNRYMELAVTYTHKHRDLLTQH